MILYSKKYGSNGQDLIILHGLFGMSDNWNSLGKRFSDYFRVHLLDLRNHGRSPHSSFFDYQCMSEDVVKYILDNQLTRPILLGHSLGGKVAMALAFKNPDIVSKLIIIDIAPKKYSTDFHRSVLEIVSGLELNNFNHRSEVDNFLSKKIASYGIRQFLLKNLYRDQQKNLRWRFNFQDIYKNLRNIETAEFVKGVCTLPTYFFRGDQSTYVLKSDEVSISNHFSNYNIITIENAGHWLHADNPNQLFNSVISLTTKEK